MLEWLPYDHTSLRPELVEARVLLVPAKQGSTALSLLPAFPLHPSLKRIRSHRCPTQCLEVLVGLWTDPSEDSLLPLVTSCSQCQAREERVLVPAGPPYTRQQCQEWSKFWPCAFKQPSILPIDHTPEELSRYRDLLLSLPSTDTLLLHPDLHLELRTRDGDGPLAHSTMLALAAFSTSHTSESQYYCQGAVVLVREEPCVMCAMALVHSRVSRVYFKETVVRGAFSKWKLHMKPVNYMYRLFQLG